MTSVQVGTYIPPPPQMPTFLYPHVTAEIQAVRAAFQASTLEKSELSKEWHSPEFSVPELKQEAKQEAKQESSDWQTVKPEWRKPESKPQKVMASMGGGGGSGLQQLMQEERQAQFNLVITSMLNKYREKGVQKAAERGEAYKFSPLVGQFIHTCVKKFCEDNKIPSVLPPKASTPGYKGPSFTSLLKQVHGINVTHVMRKGERVEAFTYLE